MDVDTARDAEYCRPPGPALETQLAAAAARIRWLFEAVEPGIKLIERDGRPQVRLEMIGRGWKDVSAVEAVMLGDAYERLNDALMKGVIKIEPGYDSAQLAQLGPALDALAPGVFDLPRLEFALSGTPQALAAVTGQWLPPGICIDLTPAETTLLIATLGAAAALTQLLIRLGFDPVVAGLVATLLSLDAALIRLCQAMSRTGAVGFKITGFPPNIVVVPYPI
jgi:hypothetical protein